jgi:hypothetical protein
MKNVVLVLTLLIGMASANTWSDPVRLLDSDAVDFSGGPGTHSQLVDDNGILHVLFFSDFEESGNREIYCMNNVDGTWSEPLRLSHGAGASHGPSMAIDADGNITVVWYDYRLADPYADVFWCRYDAATDTWSEDQPLIVTPPGVHSLIPIVVAEPTGKVHMVWCDTRTGATELFYKCFENGRWTEDVQLTDAGAYTRWVPAMTRDDAGNLHLFWADDRTAKNDWHIYYKKLRADGTWSNEMNLGPGAPHDVTVYSGHLFLTEIDCMSEAWSWGIPDTFTGIYDPDDYIPSQVKYSVKNLSDPDDVWVFRDKPVSAIGDFYVTQPAVATCRSGVRVVWGQGTEGHIVMYQATVGLNGESAPELIGSVIGNSRSISLSSGTKGDLNLVYAHTTTGDTGWDLYYRHDVVPQEGDVPGSSPRMLMGAVTPNPTAGDAVVGLDLPETGNVVVAVYDTAGRRVATVFSGTLTAGRHELTVDTAGLRSGAYFVLAAGDGDSASAPLVVTR